MLSRISQIKEEELLAIKPGERIRLELNLPFDGDQNEKIRVAHQQPIKENGWVPAADGELVFSVVMPGETGQYRLSNVSFFLYDSRKRDLSDRQDESEAG